MTKATKRAEWIEAARALGVEHGQLAASWICDGRSVDECARVLDMLMNNDPAAWGYLPSLPTLSGDWSDGLTPNRLHAQITGILPDTRHWSMIILLSEAYDLGVASAFIPTCESLLISHVRRER